jgi:hypothetical protein
MTNNEIGRIAGQLLDMEDAGQTNTPRYTELLARYEDLKSRPENWSDVRASKRTLAQQQAAAAWYAANPDAQG